MKTILNEWDGRRKEVIVYLPPVRAWPGANLKGGGTLRITKRLNSAFKALTTKSSAGEEITFNQLIDFFGLHGTPKNALSEATYFACLKVLGEGVGKLPLKVLQVTDREGVTTARGHPLYHVLKERPNPYMTATTFWSTVEYNRNHFGNAYCLISNDGNKTQLWILESDQVEVWYDNKKLFSQVPDVYYVYSASNGKRYRFGSEEILHFKTSNTSDGVVGVAVRDQLKSTIQGNQKAQELVNRMYDSGFTAKAVLQYTGELSDDNSKKFVKGIEAYAKGDLKDEGIENIIPIPLGSTLTPLNVKLGDNQFIEVKQYSALQIASAFGIKPYQIGDYTKSSYSSGEMQQLSFYVDTLLYILKQYEEEIAYKLLSEKERNTGLHVKFNVSVILRADLKTQIDTLSKAVNSFIMTPNEARNHLDYEKVEGGEQLLGNGASIPLQYAGAQYTNINGEGDKSWLKNLMEPMIQDAIKTAIKQSKEVS